jgi:hypothetical protein
MTRLEQKTRHSLHGVKVTVMGLFHKAHDVVEWDKLVCFWVRRCWCEPSVVRAIAASATREERRAFSLAPSVEVLDAVLLLACVEGTMRREGERGHTRPIVEATTSTLDPASEVVLGRRQARSMGSN